jgi:hypothetical protein
MRKSAIALCLILCSLPLRAQSPSGAKWVSIEPTKDLAGWTRVSIPPGKALNPVSQWSFDSVHRVILCRGDGGHEWLRYDRPYRNFLFEAQWKLAKVPGPPHYNSGIFVRNSADGAIWFQAQVGAPGAGYFFGDNPENGGVKRFDLKSLVIRDNLKPPGQWNTYRIRCQGETLTLWVNGVQQSEFTHCNRLQGYLGLEAEGSRISFRRLRVQVLP